MHGEENKGLKGDKSGLFYEFSRLKKEINPDWWLLENVKMKTSSKLLLDNYLDTSGVLINSSLVSYQRRARYYWSNLPLVVPEDRGVSFQDFKESGDLSFYRVNQTDSRKRMWSDGKGDNSMGACANVTYTDKIYCLTTKQDRSPNSGLVAYEDFCRFLTRGELEQAQTVPLGYTKCLSYNQAQAVLGNGWTVDVIAHIFEGLKEIAEKELEAA